MKSLFGAYRKADLTLEELARVSAKISRTLALSSDDRRIRPLNERTIRYYQGRGLLDPPARSGREARYALLHLLQVLALRRLQSEGCTLDEIDDMIRSGELPWQSVSSLERAIVRTGRVTHEARARMSRSPKRSPRLRAKGEGPSSSSKRERALDEQQFDETVRACSAAGSEGALDRLEEPLEELAKRHVDRQLAAMMPRFEAMLERLVRRRLDEEQGSRVRREIRSGVSVSIDPSQVADPDEVISRIARAMSDDG